MFRLAQVTDPHFRDFQGVALGRMVGKRALGAVNLVVQAAILRQRLVTWLSAVALLAIVGAAASGAAFVGSGTDGGSLAMALLTGVALLCYALNLFALGPARADRDPSRS